MQRIRTVSDRLLLLLLSTLMAAIVLNALERSGPFGSSLEGANGYSGAYFGFLALTAVFAVLAVRFAPKPLPVLLRAAGWLVLALVFAVLFLF